MKDFHLYKRIISLPDFLINNFDFKVMDGSSRNRPKISDGISTLILKKKNEEYTYYDIHNDSNKGSIFDFLMSKPELFDGKTPSLPEIANKLDEFIAEGQTIPPEFSVFTLNNPSITQDELSRNILSLAKEGSTDFFKKRGISEKTFNHPNFKDYILFRKVTKDKTDIAFIMYSSDSTKAISYRGYRDYKEESFKGFKGPRSQCLATSKYNTKEPLHAILFSESMIDNMAHFELNKSLTTKNIAYVSSEGSVHENQIHLLQKSITLNSPEKFCILTDNDLYGLQSSAKILGALQIPTVVLSGFKHNFSADNFLNLSKIEVPIVTKKASPTGSIKFNFAPNFNHHSIREFLTEKINAINSDISNPKAHFSPPNLNLENGANGFSISFPNDEVSWKKCNSLINEYKFSSNKFISLEFPKSKDYNQDLMNAKGLNISKDKPKFRDQELSI